MGFLYAQSAQKCISSSSIIFANNAQISMGLWNVGVSESVWNYIIYLNGFINYYINVYMKCNLYNDNISIINMKY